MTEAAGLALTNPRFHLCRDGNGSEPIELDATPR